MNENIANPAVAETGAIKKPDLDNQRAACIKLLDATLARSSALSFASVSTLDGHSFAHRSNTQNINGPRIGALSSSLLALGEAFATEAEAGACHYNVIATENGSIVLARIDRLKSNYTLSIGADKSENLATVLRYTLDLASQLAKRLSPGERSLATG